MAAVQQILSSFGAIPDPTGPVQLDALGAIAVFNQSISEAVQFDALGALAIVQTSDLDDMQLDSLGAIVILSKTYP